MIILLKVGIGGVAENIFVTFISDIFAKLNGGLGAFITLFGAISERTKGLKGPKGPKGPKGLKGLKGLKRLKRYDRP